MFKNLFLLLLVFGSCFSSSSSTNEFQSEIDEDLEIGGFYLDVSSYKEQGKVHQQCQKMEAKGKTVKLAVADPIKLFFFVF